MAVLSVTPLQPKSQQMLEIRGILYMEKKNAGKFRHQPLPTSLGAKYAPSVLQARQEVEIAEINQIAGHNRLLSGRAIVLRSRGVTSPWSAPPARS